MGSNCTGFRWGDNEEPFRSLYESETPGNGIDWVMPTSDLDTVFLQTANGYYLLQEGAISPFQGAGLLEEAESQGRITGFLAGPSTFGGEAACQE